MAKLKNEEKLLLNQLRIENLQRSTKEEKIWLVNRLKTKHQLSYRQMSERTGIATTTIHNWLAGRNDKALYKVNIDDLIEYFTDYKPRLEEFAKLETLRKLIDKILETNGGK